MAYVVACYYLYVPLFSRVLLVFLRVVTVIVVIVVVMTR